jgi:hypothetical protein
MKITELKPLENNPFKSRGDSQIKAIGKSITDFERMMTIRKIIIDEGNNILGGNKRYFALKALGYKDIPDEWIDKVEGLTEQQKREFIVKDNSHYASEWDIEMLTDWNVDLVDWGVSVDWEQEKTNTTEQKDLSGDIKETFEIIVSCSNEQEQEQTYNKLIEEGYTCRALTL